VEYTTDAEAKQTPEVGYRDLQEDRHC